MEINIKEQDKILEVWMTKEEKQEKELQMSLMQVFEVYKARKFIIAVYFSGVDNLSENTANLLCRNKTAGTRKGG